MEAGYHYFKSTFEACNGPQYSSLPTWVKEVTPSPAIISEFDMSPVTQGLFKKTLQKLSNSSAPGSDEIGYFHLRKLPSAHHFLHLQSQTLTDS